MQITYSCKISCSVEDRAKIIALLEAERLCFNECSGLHFGATKNSIKDLHAKAYRAIRNKYSYIPSQVVIRGEQACLSAYRTAKSNKHKLEKPITKHKLSIQLDKRLYSEKDGVFRITTLEKRVNVRLQTYEKFDELWGKYKHSDPKIYVKKGQLYISFCFDVAEPQPRNVKAVGVDLGIRRAAATSEGKIFIDKRYNKEKRKLRYLKRCLQSKGTKSAKRHLKKVRHTEANKTRNFCHNLTKKIVQSTKADIIVIEDLSKIKDKKKRGIPKYQKLKRLAQAPFYLIRQFLTYKALLFGKQVITVSPSFTSQIDHQLGQKSGERKGCRFYTTRRGLVYDADVNAAINIAIRSKHPVSSSGGLDGQAVVNQPIVGREKSRTTSSGL